MRSQLLAFSAALAMVSTGPIHADTAKTTGGISITSEDGNFSFQAGGRIHADAYAFDADTASTTDTTDFRRARLTLSGSAYGWDFKMEQDFAAGNTTAGFRDVYLGKKALGGYFTIGHFKPYRSMEELTSSNEITMMERPFSSGTGLYSGRQFQQGVGYKRSADNFTAGISLFNLRDAATARNEGVGAAGRFTFAPLRSDTSTVHLGLSASTENANKATPDASASVNYAGRRGPSQTIATRAGATGDAIDAVGAELAASRGPLFVQAEFANASFGQGPGASAVDVQTYYVMGSWMLTGETKPYHTGNGVFRSPKPSSPRGAWELTGRYDFIENRDVSDLEASSAILGANYYVNRNVRFMLNYTMGDRQAPRPDGSVSRDKTDQIAIRGQYSF